MNGEINSELKSDVSRTIVSYYEKSSLVLESNEDEYNHAKKLGINEPFSINFESDKVVIQLKDILVNSADVFIDGLKDSVYLIVEDIQKDRLQKPIKYDYAKFRASVICKSDDIRHLDKISVELVCKDALINFLDLDNNKQELDKSETKNLLL